MGNGDEGTEKGRSGSADMGNDEQGVGSDGVVVYELDLGGERSDVDGSIGFS